MSTGNKQGNYNVFERLYQDSRKKVSSRIEVMGNTSKRSESRVSVNSSHMNRSSLNESSDYGCLHIY